MKQYYYEKNGQQFGPYSLVEIKEQITQGYINSSSLMWFQGLESWTKASEIEEIKSDFIDPPPQNVPPPIPKNSSQTISSKNIINDLTKEIQPLITKYWKPVLIAIIAIFLIRSCNRYDFKRIFAGEKNTEIQNEDNGMSKKEIIANCLKRSGVDIGEDIDGKVEINLNNSCSGTYKFRVKKIRVWYTSVFGMGKKIPHDIKGDWIVDNQTLHLTLVLNLTFSHGIFINDAYPLEEFTTIIKK